jgi:hypothetical protein
MNITECRYGSKCHNNTCKFKHSLNNFKTPFIKKDIICKFGSKCTTTQCKFIHPKSNIYFKIYCFFALIISLYICKGIYFKIYIFFGFILLFYVCKLAFIISLYVNKLS